MTATVIQRLLAKLPAKERGMLAAWLLETLPRHSDEDSDGHGMEEATRRREELESGRVQMIPSDDFWAAIARERATWK